jgi:hypothetical protein
MNRLVPMALSLMSLFAADSSVAAALPHPDLVQAPGSGAPAVPARGGMDGNTTGGMDGGPMGGMGGMGGMGSMGGMGGGPMGGMGGGGPMGGMDGIGAGGLMGDGLGSWPRYADDYNTFGSTNAPSGSTGQAPDKQAPRSDRKAEP